MSNLIGILVVVVMAVIAVFGLRGTLGGASIAEAPLIDNAAQFELAPGPVRFIVGGTLRTAVTGGARTNRYRAVLSSGGVELAANEFSITVSQQSKVGTMRNSTTALEATIERAGTYVLTLTPVGDQPVEFTKRSVTVRAR